MDEIRTIIEKYDAEYTRRGLETLDSLKPFSLEFYKDVADIYDCFTRITNVERNPTGFSLDDAPILGLLVRIWKLMKTSVTHYEEDNAQIVAFFNRSIVESSVIAEYLMSQNNDVMEDYRKCSYKDRLQLIRKIEEDPVYRKEKAGQRLLRSIKGKMALENLTPDDFGTQEKNRWRVQGKSFFKIFSEVADKKIYDGVYGMPSESIHGSWNEVRDFDLIKNEDDTFSPLYCFHPADVRYLSPILRFTWRPHRLWLHRIEAHNENLENVLLRIEYLNFKIFKKFDELYNG